MTWARLSVEECIEKVPTTEKIQRKDFLREGPFPIVSQEAEFINGYWDNELALFRIKRPVVIFGDHTQVLKFIDFDFVRGADGVKVLSPKPFLDVKFFYYALMANPVRALGYARHYRLLAKAKLAFPRDLDEQKRIVTILDDAFAGIDKAVVNAEQNLANARELFAEALDRLTLPVGKGWETYPLKLLTSKIGSGATPRGGRDSYKESGIALIRSMNVHDRWFKEKDLAFLDDEQAQMLDGVSVQENDVLLNITGASVARCCLAPKEFLPARVNQHVAIVRPKADRVLPEFLCLMLTARHNKFQLLGIGEKAGATRQAITKANIESYKVSFPPLEEQRELIDRLNELEGHTLALGDVVCRKRNGLSELKQSLLQKAFSGTLTAAKDMAA